MERQIDTLSVEAVLNPANEQDAFTRKMRDELNYVGARRLVDGTYVGVMRLVFTLAICIGVTPYSAYTRRYCYQDAAVCLREYQLLEGGGDVPTGWIQQRPS